MKIIRLAGAMLAVALAIAFVIAPNAAAAKYLFRTQDVTKAFTGKSLPGTIKTGLRTVTCERDEFAGTIANVHLVGPFSIKYNGCKSFVTPTTMCPVNSLGAGEGEIVTLTVHGLLGLVLPNGAAGLLVLPTAGARWFTLAGNNCTTENALTGSVAGLIPASQIGLQVLDLLASFIPADITKIDTLNGLVEPQLTLFGETATLSTLEHLEWHQEVEIS